MTSQPTKWVISTPAQELCREMSRSLNISPVISQVLVNRGIETPQQADLFLGARLGDLHDPFLMKHMDRAVDRILRALAGKEKICVYGDYDVDGITATAVIYQFLRSVGAACWSGSPSAAKACSSVLPSVGTGGWWGSESPPGHSPDRRRRRRDRRRCRGR